MKNKTLHCAPSANPLVKSKHRQQNHKADKQLACFLLVARRQVCSSSLSLFFPLFLCSPNASRLHLRRRQIDCALIALDHQQQSAALSRFNGISSTHSLRQLSEHCLTLLTCSAPCSDIPKYNFSLEKRLERKPIRKSRLGPDGLLLWT